MSQGQAQPDEKVNVLLVDDQPEGLVALEAALEGLGQNLVKAASGREALKHTLALDFAVILLDVQMPTMDGYEVAALIRRRERSCRTPIIFLTASHRSEAQVFEGYTAGAVDYLFKPVIPEILRSKVAVFVELAVKNEALARLNAELKRQAAKLAAANKSLEIQKGLAESASHAKSQFVANISHELRSPLNAIIGYSDILIRGQDGALNEEQSEDLRTISSNGKHLLGLINELIDLAKIEAGKVDLYPEAVSVIELLEDVRKAFVEEARNKGVALESSAGSTAVESLRADRQRLRQILTNLVQNALKFTKQGSVKLGFDQKDGWGVFTIRDTGPGIPRDEIETVFNRFEQSKSLEKVKKGEGMGLGLHLAKHFAELHGGRIWVESELGKGTTFFVKLPRAGPGGGVS